MTDVYRVPFNYSRTSLTEVKTLAERGNLVLFNESGRVGYVDFATKNAYYLLQNADEVSYDNKYFDGNLTGVSANLQALAKYVDELSTSDIPIGDYDGNLEGLTTLQQALEVLDDFITANSIDASDIEVDVTAFNGVLSASDNTIQKALSTIDDHLHDDRYYKKEEIDDKLSTEIATYSNLTETTTVSLIKKKDINIKESGITVSVLDEVDGQRVTYRNKTIGDAYLNFNIELQNKIYTAPVTIGGGEVFELTYDSLNTRWGF